MEVGRKKIGPQGEQLYPVSSYSDKRYQQDDGTLTGWKQTDTISCDQEDSPAQYMRRRPFSLGRANRGGNTNHKYRNVLDAFTLNPSWLRDAPTRKHPESGQIRPSDTIGESQLPETARVSNSRPLPIGGHHQSSPICSSTHTVLTVNALSLSVQFSLVSSLNCFFSKTRSKLLLPVTIHSNSEDLYEVKISDKLHFLYPFKRCIKICINSSVKNCISRGNLHENWVYRNGQMIERKILMHREMYLLWMSN